MSKMRKQSEPLHIENTVMTLGKEELSVNNAFSTYRDMKLDGIVSGSVSFIKSLVSKGDFRLTTKEGGKAKSLVDAINASMDELEGYTKPRLLGQWLSCIDYGCSLNEVVLKRDGGFLVFKEISPIHLTSVERFEMEGMKLKQLHLNAPENDGLITQTLKGETSLKGDKVLFFRIEADSDFPLGKSLLYGAYSSWRAKKILQEYEAIGVAKNLSGVLEIKVPSEYLNKYFNEPNSDEALHVASLLDQAEMLHAGKGSYILLGSDTTDNGVDLFRVNAVGNGGSGQGSDVGAAIQRYNLEIQLSLQSMVLSIGSTGGGSFALSDNSTYLLSLFIDSIQKTLGGEWLNMVKRIFELNSVEVPKDLGVEWDEVQPLDWDDFTRGWSRLVSAGAVTPTQELESFIRKEGNAPMADYSKVLETDSSWTEERKETDRQA